MRTDSRRALEVFAHQSFVSDRQGQKTGNLVLQISETEPGQAT
jgi:hypothetical protein